MSRKDIVHETAMITEVARIKRSPSGNPRWAITFVTADADVITANTKVNSSVGYYVGNHLVDRFATITRTPAGSIISIVKE